MKVAYHCWLTISIFCLTVYCGVLQNKLDRLDYGIQCAQNINECLAKYHNDQVDINQKQKAFNAKVREQLQMLPDK